jgi:uncharacterized protein (TIGR00369 family)
MPDLNPKSPAASRVTLTQLMGVSDTNNMGNVHGGVLMKLCDEAGGMAAAKHARHPAVTVAVDRMTFKAPVRRGDLVTFTAQVSWVGRSSIETCIFVTAENVLTGEVTHTNTAYYLYVALDDAGRPAPVPPLLPATDEERRIYQEAEERQSRRLQLREQERPLPPPDTP